MRCPCVPPEPSPGTSCQGAAREQEQHLPGRQHLAFPSAAAGSERPTPRALLTPRDRPHHGLRRRPAAPPAGRRGGERPPCREASRRRQELHGKPGLQQRRLRRCLPAAVPREGRKSAARLWWGTPPRGTAGASATELPAFTCCCTRSSGKRDEASPWCHNHNAAR